MDVQEGNQFIMAGDDSQRALRIAILGSGPAGLYAAEALTKQHEVPVSVDVFDRLPTPYGLVRYGVAPDHQKIKIVTNALQRILEHPNVRFLGNVQYGRDLTHDDLSEYYDAVVYAVGAAADRSLNIPGEDLHGSVSATEFVSWYNSHPDDTTRAISLTASGVAVIGVGNVAIDVTRVLAKTVEELKVTDIAHYALDALSRSQVSDIYLLGRRGPAQAKFTTKELKELGELSVADVVVLPEDVALSPEAEAAVTDHAVRRNIEVLRDFAQRPLQGKPRRVHLRFLVSPVEIMGQTHVEALRVERNRLDEMENAVGTGIFETLPVQMVFRSIGYKGLPVTGVPFDARKGIIPNDGSRVLSDGEVVRGEYTTGWIKRGPTGVIGTNKACAVETITQLLKDAPDLARTAQPAESAILSLLQARNVAYVTLEDWLRLDQYELELGKANGSVRVKIAAWDDLLRLCRPECVA